MTRLEEQIRAIDLVSSTLYRRSFNTILLRCVDKKEAETLMKEVHKGACRPHMNKYVLARKIMRMVNFR